MLRYGLLVGVVLVGFVCPCCGDERDTSRRSLIIACSEFPFASGVDPLPGAANDAIRFKQLLASERYAFDDVRMLVGWHEDGDSNPTLDNITAAFERLITQTNRGDQVFILMSGHGVQVKSTDREDSTLGLVEEPDGYDEAFVAADYGPAPKVVRDDQIGEWLDQLKARGAHTWIVFDCCHSGSLTRGEVDEQPKRIRLDKSREIRQSRRPVFREKSSDTGFLDIHTDPATLEGQGADGSVVALFAAQNYETTPEVTRPTNAKRIAANRRGLLGFHLEYLLHNATGQTTYRDLENALAARYVAERGMTNGPNPYFEGNLDRMLFGMETIASPATIRLSETQGQWTLQGGVMDGVTVGSILEVSNKHQVIGEIETVEVSLNTSTIRWKTQVPKVNEPSQHAVLRCAIKKQPLNPWKVSVQWIEGNGDSREQSEAETKLREWTKELNDDSSSPITLSRNLADTVWSLCVATPQQANDRFGMTIEHTAVLLLSHNLISLQHDGELGLTKRDQYQFAAYSVDDLATAKQKLTVDFERLFRLQRILQLAGLYGEGGPMISGRGVSLNFIPLNAGEDRGDVRAANRGAVVSGEEFLVQLASTKPFPLWYTVMLVESNGLVLPIFSGTIPKGASFKPATREIERMRIRPSHNVNAYIAVTVPVKASRTPVNFSYLAQRPIGVHDHSRNSEQTANRDTAVLSEGSQLGRLFLGTSRSDGDSRLAIRQDGSQIAVRAWSIARD